MTYSRPAGSEAFAKCPIEGCFVKVYGPILTPNPCRAHGGTPMFQQHDDEYGNPVLATGDDPPRPRLASLEA